MPPGIPALSREDVSIAAPLATCGATLRTELSDKRSRGSLLVGAHGLRASVADVPRGGVRWIGGFNEGCGQSFWFLSRTPRQAPPVVVVSGRSYGGQWSIRFLDSRQGLAPSPAVTRRPRRGMMVS